MPIELVSLEDFSASMVHNLYVIMNYLLGLYGLVAESIDVSCSQCLTPFSPWFAVSWQRGIFILTKIEEKGMNTVLFWCPT